MIPAHGGESDLRRLLDALGEQADADRELPVVIVDDASPTPLAGALGAGALPRLALALVRTESNVGPGGARNRGLEHVRTPWTVFIDADEVPAAGWLARLTEILAAPDAPDAVEGRIEVAPGRPTPFTHFARAEAGTGEHVAGNVAVRTEILRALGGFDERYYDPDRGLHFREDIELYFRLIAAGHRVEFRDDVVVTHPPRPASFWTPVREARRYFFDPLLSRDHPEAFRASNRARTVGPLSQRSARHYAALLQAVAATAALIGLTLGRRRLRTLGATSFMAAWGANAAAVAWRKQVPARLALRVGAVAFVVPWVYLWNYYRGCIRFGHVPRL